MEPNIIITILIPLIERVTQALQSIKLIEKIDSRITAAVISIGLAFLLNIQLIAASTTFGGAVILPPILDILVSGYVISLGSNAIHWLFKKVSIITPAK